MTYFAQEIFLEHPSSDKAAATMKSLLIYFLQVGWRQSLNIDPDAATGQEPRTMQHVRAFVNDIELGCKVVIIAALVGTSQQRHAT